MCVANQIKYGKQQTSTWHGDDIKSIHMNTKVSVKFVEWRKETYRIDDLGHVIVVRCKNHDYSGMNMDFTQEGDLETDMKYYIKGML